MPDYPAHGLTPWDTPLRQFLDGEYVQFDELDDAVAAEVADTGSATRSAIDTAINEKGVLLNGEGPPPSNAFGSPNDFYIDTLTSELYGPKTTTWPTPPTQLIGPDGKSVLNGAAAPTGATGVDGDFYIQTTDWHIYGPKASGTWPAFVPLIGMQVVHHGTNGAVARPAAALVYWLGTVTPANALAYDFWVEENI